MVPLGGLEELGAFVLAWFCAGIGFACFWWFCGLQWLGWLWHFERAVMDDS